MKCRICNNIINSVCSFKSPNITSVTTVINKDLVIYYCDECDFSQSENISDDFYDVNYNISLVSDDHDQIYEIKDGEIVYRNDKQADVVIDIFKLNERDNLKILDYGAAKSKTLKVISSKVKITPFVFDVSSNYEPYWSWLPEENRAKYDLPKKWSSFFDIVTCHYVFEHVSDLQNALSNIKLSLKLGGYLFISVPDPIENIGDLVVIDHINHFTEYSIHKMLELNGFCNVFFHRDKIKSTIVATAQLIATNDFKMNVAKKDAGRLTEISMKWFSIRKSLAESLFNDETVYIFGAGFYGTWVAANISSKVKIACFIDSNPYLHDKYLLDKFKIRSIDAINDHKDAKVIMAVNPRNVESILIDIPQLRNRRLVYLSSPS